MKANIVLVHIWVTLWLVSCQAATATPAPISDEPVQIETATAVPTTVPTEEPTSALDAFLLTKAATTPIPTFNVSIPASACWMNSGVSVTTGQKVLITASGTVNTYGGNERSNNNPDGQIAICGAIECPVQGVGYGALVGRVEDRKPFFIGTNLEFVATWDGQLYFTVNDWECDDNSGTFDLTVKVE